MSFDRDLRTMLRDRAEGVAAAPVVPDGTVRRVRVRKALMVGTVAAALVAIAVASSFVTSVFRTDAAPVPPAGEPNNSFPENEPNPTPTIQDVLKLGADQDFGPLEPGTYFIDPDDDSSTPLRVEYEVSADGWSEWLGAIKFSTGGHVVVSIATVTNVVRHGCRDGSPADPPVGPTVDDLATALADLAPFRVTSPPSDVTIYGYRGKHLELTVPDLPTTGSVTDLRFTGCLGGHLHSWISPINQPSFSGYESPGYTEEFWILDVDGSRLMIAAGRSPDRPAADYAELQDILDSIRIKP